MNDAQTSAISESRTGLGAIFLAFLRLGLTSFGGPVAHIGYFHNEFVARRRWLSEQAYADLVALCQFLPGPASSQVGMAIGLSRGGIAGAMAAFLGFTLPSAIALVLFGLGMAHAGNQFGAGWLHGLKVVAVAVVAQALWGMGKTLAPDRRRATIAVAAAAAVSFIPSTFIQVGVIVVSGFLGWTLLRTETTLPHSSLTVPLRKSIGACFLALFFVLLIVLPVVAQSTSDYVIRLFDSFYRSGALVFGGGHVVLPLLQSQVVPAGWASNDAFLAGYGAAQAVPGPLFTFAAYLGAVSTRTPAGWAGAGIALAAIFLPAFLLVAGTLPFWEELRRYTGIRRAMLGINAAVVGLLLAAFYNPVWVSAINGPADFCLSAMAFLLLVFWKWPPWIVVLITAAAAGIGIG